MAQSTVTTRWSNYPADAASLVLMLSENEISSTWKLNELLQLIIPVKLVLEFSAEDLKDCIAVVENC